MKASTGVVAPRRLTRPLPAAPRSHPLAPRLTVPTHDLGVKHCVQGLPQQRLPLLHSHGLSRRSPLPARVAQEVLPTGAEPQGTEAPDSINEDRKDFTWIKSWYATAIVKDLDKSIPQPVRILGGNFVLWCDNKGNWHCHRDRCPHRLAPLSEGKIVQDSLQCSYHGWRFSGEGACVFLPQAPPEKAETIMSLPRSCVTAFPVQEQWGLLWVWPDDGPNRFLEASCTKVADITPPEDKDGVKWHTFLPWYLRTFPYSFDTLFDNTLDPSHVPWSHHGVIGDREKVVPLELKVEERLSPKGLCVSYRSPGVESTATNTVDKKEDPCTVYVKYGAPHTLFYHTVRDDGSQAYLLAYCTPSKPGECQVSAQTWDTRPPKIPIPLPNWFFHLIFMRAGDGDSVLLKEQEITLPELPRNWREFHLPTKADTAVRMWREWLGRFTSGTSFGPYQLASVSEQTNVLQESRRMTKQQILDRYNQHVTRCPDCQGALKGFRAATWATGVAAAVCAQLALLSALKLVVPGAVSAAASPGTSTAVAAAALSLGPLALPLHIVWAAGFALLAAAFVKAALTCKHTADSFIFEDYVHAHM